MKNSNKTRFLNRTLPQQRLISNRRENMKKLILFMVMAALMLWSPILAEAKDKTQTEAKYVTEKHHKQGKPFASLQEQIDANAAAIVDLETAIVDIGNQDQIDAIELNLLDVENRVVALENATPRVVTKSMEFEIDLSIPPTDRNLEVWNFETICDVGNVVVSGGYSIPPVAAGLVNVVGTYPDSDRWAVSVNYSPTDGQPNIPLTVFAVCIGQ